MLILDANRKKDIKDDHNTQRTKKGWKHARSTDPRDQQMRGNRPCSAGQGCDDQSGKISSGIAHRQKGIDRRSFHDGHADDLGGAGIPANHRIGQIGAVQGEHQLTGLGHRYLKQHGINADLTEEKAAGSCPCDSRSAIWPILGKAHVRPGRNGCRVIRWHQSVKIRITGKSGRTGRAGCACFPLRAGRASRACFSLRAGRTDCARFSLWAGRTDCARFSLRAGRTDCARFSLRTGRACRSCFPLWAGRTDCARFSLRAGRTDCARFSLRTGRACRSCFPLWTGRACRSCFPLWANRASRARFSLWSGGSHKAGSTGKPSFSHISPGPSRTGGARNGGCLTAGLILN